MKSKKAKQIKTREIPHPSWGTCPTFDFIFPMRGLWCDLEEVMFTWESRVAFISS
jgi:hypothetical protein